MFLLLPVAASVGRRIKEQKDRSSLIEDERGQEIPRHTNDKVTRLRNKSFSLH